MSVTNVIFELTPSNNYTQTLQFPVPIFADYFKIACQIPVICICSLAKPTTTFNVDINNNITISLNNYVSNISEQEFQETDNSQISEITLTLAQKPINNSENYSISLILKKIY
jgi:hypothetical protein